MIVFEFILIILGAFVTFFSNRIARAILRTKREPNEADIVYIKLFGFALILAAAIMVFI